ncbi:hypothetical protein K2173_000574 [Erythroxylum novogranatense]|uniref:Exostosin GT47 domain-containing protein n=1 Tax=Erythroxylum novogranatense TaxID=1862640 RepID=A0AAV8S7J6_9ROSI|nr:hypothetical protein K2173_000574 [Erythroxylum novogranatense]
MRQLCRTHPEVAFCALASLFLAVLVILVWNSSIELNYSFVTTSLLFFQMSSDSFDQKKQNVPVNRNKSLKEENSWKGDRKLRRVEESLATARSLIKEASKNTNCTADIKDVGFAPQGGIYRNACLFYRSYLLMENLFKIFVYEEGEPPLFHNGPCKYIFSTEGLFFSLMETNTHFRTYDPDEAQVYFLPFSVVEIRTYLYDQRTKDKGGLKRSVVDYVRMISNKYPYWNRSLGADHFMLSCHNWAPWVTWYVPELFHNSIRVLCNANTSERFKPEKDASFPEIHLQTGQVTGLTGGLLAANRTILAFFAGQAHGKIRPALFEHWKEKDKDVLVYEKLPEGVDYNEMMKKSKFCICPSGHEVASPRVVEAIYVECVPVLISQHYIIPFSDVLNWDSFSIQVSLSDLPNLKKILMAITQDEYLRMKERVKQVQQHFVINDPPKRFDVFHMILHSIWLRRLNVQLDNESQ